jgi:hypothetical protein
MRPTMAASNSCRRALMVSCNLRRSSSPKLVSSALGGTCGLITACVLSVRQNCDEEKRRDTVKVLRIERGKLIEDPGSRARQRTTTIGC